MKTKTQFTNRILSLVLSIMMVVSMLPMSALTASAAETEYDGVIGELYYKVDKENNVTTIFGNGALSSVSSLANVMTSNVVIEEGVTSIGNNAFRGLSSLEELTVKGDVTIGNYAFQGCASLETITFMGNVTSVGRNAFYGCASLTNINYYGTTEPSYTNTLSYITLYSFNGVPFCGLTPSNPPATQVPCSGDHTGWTELSSLTETVPGCYEITSGGKYYLSDDVRNSTNYRPTIRITCTEDVTLCLNGKTIYPAQSPSSMAVSLSADSTLNLCDCACTGRILGEEEILFAHNNATINMYSGTLKDSTRDAVYLMDGASFNMYGGTITGCNQWYGEAAITSYYFSQINIYGGNISDNHKYAIRTDGSIYISGDAKITGNVKGDVYLREGQTITTGTLTSGADIGITTVASENDIAITGSNTADYSRYFHSDNSSYAITNKGNKIYLHKHTCTYSATENKITQTCSVCNKHTATATLTADDVIYTGAAIATGASVTFSDNWAGSKEHGEITYSDNLFVGDATAKVTVADKELVTTFKINPANIAETTVTFDPENGIYNGSAYTPGVTVTFNGATLVEDKDYTLSWNSSDLTNADTYTVTVTGKGNFKGTKTQFFTINAAELSDIKVEQVGTLTYTGEAQTPTVSANAVAVNNQPITFTYSTESEGPYSTEIPSFTNAGWAHTVYYRATADNHNTYYGSFLVEIEKATVTEPTIASKPYNGSVQTADISDTDLYTVEKNNGGTEKGSYDVVLKLKDSANYKWSTTNNAEVTLQFKITQARNAWVTEPSISGWTYGEAANEPVGEAKFGTVYVLYDGTANDGTTYDGDTPPTKAGSYVARFFVDEAANYEPIGDGVEFIIAKADQAAPTGLTKRDTTYFGKADGKISGLTSAMEFRKEGASTYTAGFNGTLEYLAAGTYYVRYQGDPNHNPSPDAVVTVNAGRKLQIVVPQNQVGYTVTVNKTEMEYEGSYTLKVEIHEGYTATEDFKIIISNWECGQQAGVEETYMNAIADQIIEVRGVADITPPAAEIKVKENKWTSFWNNLTFGLFFKETQDVTITTTDKGSGVKSIQYYLFDRELERDEVRSITDWIDYNGAFKINPDNRYVIYVKVTDNAGNVEYINSEGIVLDATAPVLYGIENGGVYHGDKVFKATDDYLKILKVDGVDVIAELNGDNEYKIIADNAEHTVTAIDEAGNVTEYKITVYKNYTVTYKIDGKTVDTQTVGHGKDANLPAVPAKNGYVGKWNSDGKNITGDTTITAVYTEIPVVKPNEVKPEDKTDLEDTKKQLEDMLKDDSYTDEDKKNIQDAIDDIDDALEVIGNVEAVEKLIDKLPDTIKKDDETAIKAADDAHNALSDYEKSLVDEDAKKALADAKAALAELNKTADPNSPATGDNSHVFLWIALLFISGGAVITLAVVDRKRKAKEN